MRTEDMPRHTLFALINIVHACENLSLAPHFRNPVQCQIRSTERQAQNVAVHCATADTVSCPWGRSPGLTQAVPVTLLLKHQRTGLSVPRCRQCLLHCTRCSSTPPGLCFDFLQSALSAAELPKLGCSLESRTQH